MTRSDRRDATASASRVGEGVSWLCSDDAARTRLLDMDGRLHRARLITFTAMTLSCAGLATVYAPWRTFSPLVLGIAATIITRVALPRSRRPELWIFWCLAAGSMAAWAVGATLTGGPRSPLLPGLALFVLMISARFNDRGTRAGIALCLAMTAGVALSHGLTELLEAPALAIVTVASVVIVHAYVHAMAGSDQEHRADAVLDALTGLLNRRSLEMRVREFQAQGERANTPVAAIAIDIDHFKIVNDRFGHDTGDVVLRDVAYTMRKCLRHFDLLYRVGGEEFLLLVPGGDTGSATRLAEQLRTAVAASRPAGLEVTVSLGVASVMLGGHAMDELLHLADVALYGSKQKGRNQTTVAPESHRPALATLTTLPARRAGVIASAS